MKIVKTNVAYRGSKSWKSAAPMRLMMQVCTSFAKIKRLWTGAALMSGGIIPAARRALRVVRREGFAALNARANMMLAEQSLASVRGQHLLVHRRASRLERPDCRFDYFEKPEISIIIPVYNNVEYTIACLISLNDIDRSHSFEIIVMDDGSSDDTERHVRSIGNVRYVRNVTNLGFLRNCNKGASLARGEYLVFLNNDTVVDQNWLKTLRRTYSDHANVGLVGSKLIYPDGRLQEAGGIIWQDGSAWNWGRLKDPAHPAYNYVRDVDYVSGASIMISRDHFERLGSFDERYETAYYEDTDLAMSVRAAGLRVLVQPQSIVIHHEGVSSGTNENSGAKRFQVTNGRLFFEKWGTELVANLPNGAKPFLACDRQVRGHILVVDACTPTPDQDSGSVDMINLIQILISLGYRVHFVPQNDFAHFGRYTEHLQSMGVECIYAPFYRSVNEFLQERGDMFGHVILARVNVARDTIDCVKKHCTSARLIFYTVDLHFLREKREAELLNDDRKRRLSARTEMTELGLMDQVDTTIVLSEAERGYLDKVGKTNIAVVPLIRETTEPTSVSFENRYGALFIGGYQHAPNVDAVDWLAAEIWPEVRRLCSKRGIPPIPLNIYGSKMPERFHDYAATDFHVHGFAADLRSIFSKVRLSVAPLRYGAGLKGKLATSFGYGVPAVGTVVAFEGYGHDIFKAVTSGVDDAKSFASLIFALHCDKTEWEKQRQAAREYVIQSYSIGTITAKLKAVLEPDRNLRS